jgi:hypothetical protein
VEGEADVQVEWYQTPGYQPDEMQVMKWKNEAVVQVMWNQTLG